MSDEDKEIASVWTEVWDDLTPGREPGATLYLSEIVALAVNVFTATTSSYVLKVNAMKAVAEAATLTGLLFAPHLASILPLILKSLPGRLWSGKEVLLSLSVDLLKACKLVHTQLPYAWCLVDSFHFSFNIANY
jgi:proteasome component ECM29